MIDKKAAKSDYLMSHRPMGVFLIRNTRNERVFVDSSLNIPGKINRHRFSLNVGTHACKTLQNDWNEYGERAFEFETLEDVLPRADANYDYAADLETLKELWLEKLEPYGNRGYNDRKLTREQRLEMIRANRRL